MQTLGERYRDPVGKRLQQDRVVVVVRRLEAGDMLLDADTGRYGESADMAGARVPVRPGNGVDHFAAGVDTGQVRCRRQGRFPVYPGPFPGLSE